MKIIIPILRILLGFVFIASAILKLFSIEAFDARILETAPFLGWTLSMVAARLIIACELALGIFVVAGMWLRRVVYPLTLAMLLFFTGILIYSLIRYGNEPNCGCFGELLPFTNMESFIKNIVFIALTLFLYYRAPKQSLRFWWIGVIILGASIFTIFMMHKIPLYLDEIELKEPFPARYLECENYQIEEDNKYEKHLVVFLSTKCAKCKEMTRNLETMNRIYPMKNVYFFICEDSTATNLQMYQDVSFPIRFIPTDTFHYYLPAPYLPFLGIVDSGKFTRVWTGANFNFDREVKILWDEGIVR